jgi:hypothetical protein
MKLVAFALLILFSEELFDGSSTGQAAYPRTARSYLPRRSNSAIPCSETAQQRHKIIRKRVALLGDEGVSAVTGAALRRLNQETPLMRIYILAMTESPSAASRRLRLCHSRIFAIRSQGFRG